MISKQARFTTFASSLPRNRRKSNYNPVTGFTPYLDAGLLDLVRLRLAQIHGCKRSIAKYTNKLKAKGETAERLQRLMRWRREEVFSLKEKAALNLAEALCHNPLSPVSNTAILAAIPFFTEEEIILLALEIVAITDRHYLKTFQHDDMISRPPHE